MYDMKSLLVACFIMLSMLHGNSQCNDIPSDYTNDACGNNPNVNFTATGVATFCENQEVTFINETVGGDGYYDYFIIDWGDGSPCQYVYNYDPVVHIFNFNQIDKCEEGPKFDANMRFIGIKECMEGITSAGTPRPYEVKLSPVAKFEFDQVVCINDQVVFQNTSCNADSLEWDFNNDGIIDSHDDFANYIFQTPGNHTISLKVFNDCGSHSVTKTIYVVGYPEAEIEMSVPNGRICEPDYFTLSLDANEWTTGISGHFEWLINPAYTNMNGRWCFVNQDSIGTNHPCLHDSLFFENTLDSLLSLEEVNLYFRNAGEYVVTLNYSNVCESLSVKDTIFVYEPPYINGLSNISACDELELCFDDLNVTVPGDYDSVLWTFTNASISSSNNLDFGCVTFTGSGTMTLFVNASDPCMDVPEMVYITIVKTTEVTIEDPDPNIICQNAGLIELFPSENGGVYIYNGSTANFITGNMLNPSNLAAGNYTVTYKLSTNPDCPAEAEFMFTIQEGPTITLGNNPAVCESINDFNPLISNYDGDIDDWVWTIYNESWTEILTSNNQNPLFDIFTPGTFYIVVELISDECGSVFDTSQIIIQPNIPVIIDLVNTPYCQGSSSVTLMASPLGGIWSGEGIIDQENGIFDPGILDPGSYFISYEISDGPCTSIDSILIEVVASQHVIAPDTFMCTTDPPIQLFVDPPGGIFSGSGIIDNQNGVFDGLQVGFGSHDVLYEYVDQHNCKINSNIIIEVDSIPILSLNDTTVICIDNEDIILSSLIDFDTNGANGVMYFDGPGIVDNLQGIFNGFQLSEGFYTISIVFQTRSCSTQDSFVIELAEKPVLELSQDTTVCISDGTLILFTNLNGGFWSSSECSIDSSGLIDLSANVEGHCIFEYNIGSGTSCEQSDIVNVAIIDMNNDLFVPNSFSICYSNQNLTIPSFGPLGGTWSGEGIINQTNGTIDLSQLDQGTSYTYKYCIESTLIDCQACKETVITIEALPIAAFSLDGSPCQNQIFSLNNLSSGNASAFIWDFGDGSPPLIHPEPSHKYVNEGDYTITLIASTSFGCKDTISQLIHVTAPPSLVLNITTDEGCAPLILEYVNNSYGEGIKQFWVIEEIDTIFTDQPIIILDSVWTDSLITIELVVYNGCETLKSSKDILVHPYPLVNFGINDDEGCSPDTVYFINATLGLPEEFFWDFGNGNTTFEKDPMFQVFSSPDDSISIYTISLYASNMCGEDYLEKEIKVFPNNVEAFFEIDTLSGCPPLSVTLKNYATTGAIVSYNLGDGGTSNEENFSYTYTQPGKFVITQYAALCGQDSIKSDTITIFPLPKVEFELPSYVCVGDTVKFANLSSGGISSEWDFGDGNISFDHNPIHIYDSPGIYLVKLIMYSTFYNCPDTLTKTIIVPALPKASFEVNPKEICPNETVTLINQSIGAINFEWNFGDNSGSEEENPSHSYDIPGIYEISLTVYDEYGCLTDSNYINFIVNEAPISSFTVPILEPCQFHDTIYVKNTSKGFINSIWQLNGEMYSENDNDIELSFDEYGSKQIKLISINTFGCKDSSAIEINVLPSPIAKSNFVDTSGCQKLTIDFINLSENSNLTNWILDGENTSVNNNFTHTYINHGTFESVLIASNTNGCPSDTLFMEINVFPRAIPLFEIVPFDSCGLPKDINILNLSEFSSDYKWDFGNGDTSNLYEPITTYHVDGIYFINLVANNEYNCPDKLVKSISLFPQPFADFSIPDFELCEGDTIQIVNNSSNANNYIWLLNDEENISFPLIFTENGTYSVTLISNYSNKCSDTLTLTNRLKVFDSPIVGFSYIANLDKSIIGDVKFINLSVDADKYRWVFGDGNESTIINPTHDFNKNGPIYVCLFGYNLNNGNFICENKYCDYVEFELINTFFAPNALSPDKNFGDFEVGVFKPKGVGLKEYELNIYSPWGDKIATLSKVLNGEPIDFWDGTFKGKPVPQGAYLWTAKIVYESGNTDFQKGNVTVIR